MKTTRFDMRRGRLLSAIAAACLFLAACSNGLQSTPSSEERQTGPASSVTVSIKTGAASARTQAPAIAGFALVLSKDGAAVATGDFTGTSGTLEAVPEGSYDLSVQAYATGTDGSSKVVVARGASSVSVNVNEPASATVALSWGAFPASGTGGFSLEMRAPTALSTYGYLGVHAAFREPPIATSPEPSTAGEITIVSLANESFAPGCYLVQGAMIKNEVGTQAVWSDTLWIFPGVTTSSSRTFSSADFGSLPAALIEPSLLFVNGEVYVDGAYGDKTSESVVMKGTGASAGVIGEETFEFLKPQEPAFNINPNTELTLSLAAQNSFGVSPATELSLTTPASYLSSGNCGGVDSEKVSFDNVTSSTARLLFNRDGSNEQITDWELQVVQADSLEKIDTFAEVWALAKQGSWGLPDNEGNPLVEGGFDFGYSFSFAYPAPVVAFLVRQISDPDNLRWFTEPVSPVADTVAPTLDFSSWWVSYEGTAYTCSARDNLDPASKLTWYWWTSTDPTEIDTFDKARFIEPYIGSSFSVPSGWAAGGGRLYASVAVEDSAGNVAFAGPLEASDPMAPRCGDPGAPDNLNGNESVGLSYPIYVFKAGVYRDNYYANADFSFRVTVAKAADLPGDYSTTVTKAMVARLDAATQLLDWTAYAALPTIDDAELWGLAENTYYAVIVQTKDPAGNVFYQSYEAISDKTNPHYVDSALEDQIYAAVNPAAVTGDFTLPVNLNNDGTMMSIAWSEQSDPGNHVSVSGGSVTVIPSEGGATFTLRATISPEGDEPFTRDYDFTLGNSTKGIISGIVKNLGDVMQAGIPVMASVNSDMSSPAGSATTGSSGDYSMAVDPGSYYVAITSSVGVPFGTGLITDLGGGVYRSTDSYVVNAGATTTFNFTIDGY